MWGVSKSADGGSDMDELSRGCLYDRNSFVTDPSNLRTRSSSRCTKAASSPRTRAYPGSLMDLGSSTAVPQCLTNLQIDP